jgi:hypothetical protein
MLHSWSWSQTGCDRTRPSPRIDPYWQRIVFCKWAGLIGNGLIGESMLFNGPIINPRFKVYSWFVLSMGSFFTSYPR